MAKLQANPSTQAERPVVAAAGLPAGLAERLAARGAAVTRRLDELLPPVSGARGRVIVTSPQYVQIDPVELGPMLEAIDSGADLVSPWRTQRVDPLLNRVQSTCFNWLIRQIIRGGSFHDLNCTFRAIRRTLLDLLGGEGRP